MTDEKSMMFMKIVGKATLAPDISGVGGCGGTCSFFSVEKKEPKKSRLAILPHMLLSSIVLGSYIWEATLLPCDAWFAQSQRRLLLALFVAHANYNLTSFRDPANGRFLF